MSALGGEMKLSPKVVRVVAVVGSTVALVVAGTSGAFAADVVTPVITSATADLQTTLLATGGVAIGIGGVVLALRKGWRFFKGMI
jgi:hypothetical protein